MDGASKRKGVVITHIVRLGVFCHCIYTVLRPHRCKTYNCSVNHKGKRFIRRHAFNVGPVLSKTLCLLLGVTVPSAGFGIKRDTSEQMFVACANWKSHCVQSKVALGIEVVKSEIFFFIYIALSLQITPFCFPHTYLQSQQQQNWQNCFCTGFRLDVNVINNVGFDKQQELLAKQRVI